MGGKVQDKGTWRMRTCLQLLSKCWLHVCKKKHHDTRNYTEFLNIYVHLHSFLTNFSPYCFTDTQTDPSISVSPLFPNLITLFSLSSFVAIVPSLSLCLDEARGRGDSDLHGNSPATGLVLATNQSMLWHSLSSNEKGRGGGCAGGSCGLSRWIFGEVWRLPGWSENIGISELRRGNFPVVYRSNQLS